MNPTVEALEDIRRAVATDAILRVADLTSDPHIPELMADAMLSGDDNPGQEA